VAPLSGSDDGRKRMERQGAVIGRTCAAIRSHPTGDRLDPSCLARCLRKTIALSSQPDRSASRALPVSARPISNYPTIHPDALVMGSHGNARLREDLFGGMIRQMLSTPPVPLLIVHQASFGE